VGKYGKGKRVGYRDNCVQKNLFEQPVVTLTIQLTIWFFNDGERDRFFPTLDKAEAAAFEFLKGQDEWTQIDIECCATPRLTNDAICVMLGEDSGWMVGRRVFESATKDGEIIETDYSKDAKAPDVWQR
jgi:hypothetical protein